MIDAQSFFWLMYLLEEGKSDYIYPAASENETVVVSGHKEGRKIEYYVKKYERNPANREAAIRVHGYVCKACGFDFAKVYGALGKNFIEVHHIVPLSSLDEEIIVNPETDLVCLCSNCHRMVHRKKNAIVTIDELKSILRSRK